MAIDIQKSITSNNIKNGTLITTCTITGQYSLQNNNVSNLPSINQIEDIYDTRFDDIAYYTLGNNTIIGG